MFANLTKKETPGQYAPYNHLFMNEDQFEEFKKRTYDGTQEFTVKILPPLEQVPEKPVLTKKDSPRPIEEEVDLVNYLNYMEIISEPNLNDYNK
jgi:hypothetical protein